MGFIEAPIGKHMDILAGLEHAIEKRRADAAERTRVEEQLRSDARDVREAVIRRTQSVTTQPQTNFPRVNHLLKTQDGEFIQLTVTSKPKSLSEPKSFSEVRAQIKGKSENGNVLPTSGGTTVVVNGENNVSFGLVEEKGFIPFESPPLSHIELQDLAHRIDSEGILCVGYPAVEVTGPIIDLPQVAPLQPVQPSEIRQAA